MRVTFDIISGDRRKNKLMRCMDVFEPSKVLGTHKRVSLSVDFDLWNIVSKIKSFLEQDENELISFIGISSIDGSPAKDSNPYFKSGLRTISNGYQFTTFKSMLEKLGYEVETDDTLIVTHVGNK